MQYRILAARTLHLSHAFDFQYTKSKIGVFCCFRNSSSHFLAALLDDYFQLSAELNLSSASFSGLIN